jgi:hypothetical protein
MEGRLISPIWPAAVEQLEDDPPREREVVRPEKRNRVREALRREIEVGAHLDREKEELEQIGNERLRAVAFR